MYPGLPRKGMIAGRDRCGHWLREPAQSGWSCRAARLTGGMAMLVSCSPCRAYVDRLRKANADATLTVYPGARHIFDIPVFKTPIRVPGAQVTRRCDLEEGPDGTIIETTTRKPFGYKDSCMDRGVTVEYNDAARSKAELAVRALLTDAFGLKENMPPAADALGDTSPTAH